MKKQIRAIFCLSLLLSVFANYAVAIDNPCNEKEVRKIVIENINTVWKDEGLRAVDIYEGKTIKIEPFTCEYTVVLGSTEKLRIRYEEKENSLGETIVYVEPLTEPEE